MTREPSVTILLKPASSLCDMACGYCFYRDVSQNRDNPVTGLMELKTAKAIADNVFASIPTGQVTFAFQGGEPTLVGIGFYEEFCGYAEAVRGSVRVNYIMQTNGLNLDEGWLRLFLRHNFLVGLSLDGPAETHNANRKKPDGGGTFNAVMDAKRLLENYKVPFNVLLVLTNEAARHPERIWSFLTKERIEYVQFIPCLGALGDIGQNAAALSPERFLSFYTALFRLWAAGVGKGRVRVKLFDDLASFYGWGVKTACGMDGECGLQFAAEADGTVYPCDFYALDRLCMGNLATDRLEILVNSRAAQEFIADAHRFKNPAICAGCPYLHNCGGGCKRMFGHVAVGKSGICRYKELLNRILKPLLNIYKTTFHV